MNDKKEQLQEKTGGGLGKGTAQDGNRKYGSLWWMAWVALALVLLAAVLASV